MLSTEPSQVEIAQAMPVAKNKNGGNGPVLPAAQAKKFRFDFLKSLDPGKKKITTLEAQRIFSVVEVSSNCHTIFRNFELIGLREIFFVG